MADSRALLLPLMKELRDGVTVQERSASRRVEDAGCRSREYVELHFCENVCWESGCVSLSRLLLGVHVEDNAKPSNRYPLKALSCGACGAKCCQHTNTLQACTQSKNLHAGRFWWKPWCLVKIEEAHRQVMKDTRTHLFPLIKELRGGGLGSNQLGHLSAHVTQ